jgi:hypothetical protein
MLDRRSFYSPSKIDKEYAERTRALVKTSRELLRQSLPDTFLGRKTREPLLQERFNCLVDLVDSTSSRNV